MASINIKKLHGGEAAAILAHTHRHDGRPGVEYGNEHVDASRTHLNSVLHFRGAPAQETSAEELARLKARVAEIDAVEPPARIRKDRVTLVSFEVPVPAGLPPEREAEFFKAAFSEIARFCGGRQNCGTIRIHRDEVHDYLDPVTREKRTSRVHAHCVAIPYVEGRGVNCKAFTSRERLRQIQQAIDSRCRRDLGIPYLDGSRQRSRGSVEDLKLASSRAEREERYLAELRRDCQEAQDELITAQQGLMNLQERTEALRASQRRLEASVDALRAEAAELRDTLPIVRRVGLAAEILDSLDSDLAEDFRQILADGGIRPDDPRLVEAAEAVDRASRRRARHSDRGRESGLDR